MFFFSLFLKFPIFDGGVPGVVLGATKSRHFPLKSGGTPNPLVKIVGGTPNPDQIFVSVAARSAEAGRGAKRRGWSEPREQRPTGKFDQS